LLSQYGVVNYWSYMDLWNNPFLTLSCTARRRRLDMIRELGAGGWLLRSVSARRLLYLATHGLRSYSGEPEYEALMQRPFKLAPWRKILAARPYLRRLHATPLVMYGPDATSFTFHAETAWVFDTLYLNHLGLQLRPPAIDRLIREGGLLVAHCYLCAHTDLLPDNCFAANGLRLSLHPGFVTGVEYLAERQRQGELVTLSFAHLRQSLATFARSSLVRRPEGWLVRTGRAQGRALAGPRDTVRLLDCPAARKCYRRDVGRLLLPEVEEMTLRLQPAGAAA
jgi:hypothetical protein